ncbi:MAG: hypothetical protein N2646_09135, partial [Bellilinea sp.]|nr:hypothetical protein [Bellilinea sp.]
MNQTIALKSGWTVLRRMITLLVISVLALALPLTTAQAYSGYPTFDISEVKKDQSVTIQIKNL